MKNNLDKKLIFFECASLVFCIVFSFINHYLFEWTKNCVLIAPFVPINESVWEHGKLLFFPFLFFSVFQSFYFTKSKNFLFAKSLCLLLCTPVMIMFYYTYTGIIGYHVLIIDILIAVTIIIFMHFLSYKILTSEKTISCNFLYIIVIIIIFVFVIFTFFPPKIPLFMDSTTGLYGISY